jgi:hypothetical protein
VRLNSARMISVRWDWTDLPRATKEEDSTSHDTALLSVAALRELLLFVRESKPRGRQG